MKNPLMELTDAEDFFDFYHVPYHSEILNISRVHILKKFRMYLKEDGYLDGDTSDRDIWRVQRALLFRAYREFLKPTPVRQKFFPSFYERNGFFIPFENIRNRGE